MTDAATTPGGPLPDPSWNPLPRPPARARTLHGLFDWCVAGWPDAIAVVDGGRRITYAQLAAASEDFAAELAERGAGPGALVPVLMPRSAELLGRARPRSWGRRSCGRPSPARGGRPRRSFRCGP
ncbi:AMP-binding protein [Streptomyces hayashii]|uniref:AMP-binding protein n=1 Tax=Streptomyces hayashii TaxID=2839966 RepID=UPI00403C6570